MSDLPYDKSFFYAIGLFINPKFPNLSGGDLVAYLTAIKTIYSNIDAQRIFTKDTPPKIAYNFYISGVYRNNFNKIFGPKIKRVIMLTETPTYADATKYSTIDVLVYILNRMIEKQPIDGSEPDRFAFLQRVIKIIDLINGDSDLHDNEKQKLEQLKTAYGNYQTNFRQGNSNVPISMLSQSTLDLLQPQRPQSAQGIDGTNMTVLCQKIKNIVRGLLSDGHAGVTSRELLAVVPQEYMGVASKNAGFFFALIWQEILKQSGSNTTYKNEDLRLLIPQTTEQNHIPSQYMVDINTFHQNICARNKDWRETIKTDQSDDEMLKYGVALTLACNA